MEKNFFKTGGAVDIGLPSYIDRSCDRLLLNEVKQGRFCYVLSARQMGKSSLRVKLTEKLTDQNYLCVPIDLSAFGTDIKDTSSWYFTFINSINRQISPDFKFRAWWAEQENTPVNRLISYLDIILTKLEPTQNIIIFVDEIDSLLSINKNIFSTNDFFACIRAIYQRRVEIVSFERITFVVLGVASPNDLMTDKDRTPFNIGTGIPIENFLRPEINVLGNGLEHLKCNVMLLLDRIYYWTKGQPILTQILAESLSLERSEIVSIEDIVDQHVNDLFLNRPMDDTININLLTIENRITDDDRHGMRMLQLYEVILSEGKIADNSTDPAHIYLKLTGLVKKSANSLIINNKIYEHKFDEYWVKETKAKINRPFNASLNEWIGSSKSEEKVLKGKALDDFNAWCNTRDDLTLQEKEFQTFSFSIRAKDEFRAQFELARAETERAIAERQKAVADAERQKGETEKAEAEKQHAEIQRIAAEKEKLEVEQQLAQKRTEQARLVRRVIPAAILIIILLGVLIFELTNVLKEAKDFRIKLNKSKIEADASNLKSKQALIDALMQQTTLISKEKEAKAALDIVTKHLNQSQDSNTYFEGLQRELLKTINADSTKIDSINLKIKDSQKTFTKLASAVDDFANEVTKYSDLLLLPEEERKLIVNEYLISDTAERKEIMTVYSQLGGIFNSRKNDPNRAQYQLDTLKLSSDTKINQSYYKDILTRCKNQYNEHIMYYQSEYNIFSGQSVDYLYSSQQIANLLIKQYSDSILIAQITSLNYKVFNCKKLQHAGKNYYSPSSTYGNLYLDKPSNILYRYNIYLYEDAKTQSIKCDFLQTSKSLLDPTNTKFPEPKLSTFNLSNYINNTNIYSIASELISADDHEQIIRLDNYLFQTGTDEENGPTDIRQLIGSQRIKIISVTRQNENFNVIYYDSTTDARLLKILIKEKRNFILANSITLPGEYSIKKYYFETNYSGYFDIHTINDSIVIYKHSFCDTSFIINIVTGKYESISGYKFSAFNKQKNIIYMLNTSNYNKREVFIYYDLSPNSAGGNKITRSFFNDFTGFSNSLFFDENYLYTYNTYYNIKKYNLDQPASPTTSEIKNYINTYKDYNKIK